MIYQFGIEKDGICKFIDQNSVKPFEHSPVPSQSRRWLIVLDPSLTQYLTEWNIYT